MEQACVAPYSRRRFGGMELRPFEPFFRSLFDGPEAAIPVDVEATDEHLLVRASVPGVAQDNLEVTVEDGRLTIVARAAEEGGDGDRSFVRREIARGEQSRTLRLPRNLDIQQAESSYRDGVLEIKVPRSEASRPHRIKIS